jgi:DNA-3-methyladenine glycosylase II
MKSHRLQINKGIKHLSLSCPHLDLYVKTGQKFSLLPQPVSVNSYFESLVRSVIAQQISSQAANTIFDRVHKATKKNLTPRTLLNKSETDLRELGLSGAKIKTVKSLAQAQLSKTIDLAQMPDMSDNEIIEMLTSVWGIGQWTVEMFLMFSLGRLDVWPVGDLAVRKGWQVAHNLKETPTEKQLLPLGDVFAPYRSIAAWYCWRVLEPQEPW